MARRGSSRFIHQLTHKFMSENINDEETVGGAKATAANHCADREPVAGAEEAENAPETTEPAETTETTTPAPNDAQAQASDAGEGVKTPTPEEQAELDAMVDYTIKEGDIETLKIPADIVERDNLKVGDVIKVAKDHPLLSATE